MSFSFALALICVLLTLGRDGRWLFIYGVACVLTVASFGSGWLVYVTSVFLFSLNGLAWIVLRRFARVETLIRPKDFQAILPVLATLLLELVLAFSGASLGLVPTLSVGLILAGLCVVGCGQPLSQFCGLLMAADGLLVMACVLSSWGLCATALALWAVLAVLGMTLLPRLAWRKVEMQESQSFGTGFWQPERKM